MKIAILGGSFDPPHLGHMLIAEQVKENLSTDKVWLMPLFQKKLQDKIFHKKLSPVEDRFAMAKMFENDYITVSDFEITHNQTSYSLNTLQELQVLHPHDTFFWIFGSDQLQGFQKYYKWKELLGTQNLIIFPREHMLWDLGERVKKAFMLRRIPENVIVLHDKKLILTNISSTLVRMRVMNGLSIDFLVPNKVKDYIVKHRLYVK